MSECECAHKNNTIDCDAWSKQNQPQGMKDTMRDYGKGTENKTEMGSSATHGSKVVIMEIFHLICSFP